MADIQDIPSGVSDNVTSEGRTFVDYVESIGKPSDPVATDADDENSMVSLLKGMMAGLGISAGSGLGTVNTHANLDSDLMSTLGRSSDAAAQDASSTNSAISLLKGILAAVGV